MRAIVLVLLVGCLKAPPFAGAADADVTDALTDGCHGTMRYGFTKMLDAFTPPPCATTMTIDATGAQGGAAGIGAGGRGGHINATIAIVPGATYFVTVGQEGEMATSMLAGAGGYNFGGNGGLAPPVVGAGGGGASDVRTSAADLGSRIVVAAGGGGATYCQSANEGANGGDGGADVGDVPQVCQSEMPGSIRATGGTQSAAGMGGSINGMCMGGDGAFGAGGSGCTFLGGGGGAGAGWWGGGGGSSSGGAGGSNYADPNAVVNLTERGTNPHDGAVMFIW